MPTDVETIKARVKRSFKEYEGESEKYRQAVSEFRDNSLDSASDYGEDDSEDADDTRAVGTPNHMRTNIQTTQASIAFADPDFHLKCDADIENADEIALKTIRAAWEALGLTDLANKASLNSSIGGKGILRYLVDADGEPAFEHVRKCDFAPDPDAADWNNLRYASCQIKVPPAEVRKRYPAYAKMFSGTRNSIEDQKPICLTLYFDRQTEAVLYKDHELSVDDNVIGRLPFIYLAADMTPDDGNDTGDYDNALGLQTELTQIGAILSSHAKNAGPLNLYNGSVIKSRKQLRALENGKTEQWINVGGALDRAFNRIPAEEISPVLLDWYRQVNNKLDESMAVDPGMRGGASESKFATDIMVQANMSKSRLDQKQRRYEKFCRKVAETLVEMLVRFGKPDTMEEMYLLTILQSVTDLRVVEGSTAYKDPTQELQKAKLMLDTFVELNSSVGPALGFLPNWKLLTMDFVRACEKQNVERYLLPLPILPPVDPMAAQGVPAPGAVPTAAGEASPSASPAAPQPAGTQAVPA